MAEDVSPGTTSKTDLASQDIRKDLMATVGARRELGTDLDDHLIGAFLDRIETQIDARVDQRIAARRPAGQVSKSDDNPIAVVGASLALAIPLVAIAGGLAGGIGVAAVMVAVLAINLMYFLHEADVRRRG